jgi:hypothetical protein
MRLAGAALVASVCAAGSVAPRAGSQTALIGVEGRANAFASIAASGAVVGVAWAARTPDGVTDIYTAISADAGRVFRAPVRVNRVAGEARVSGEQPPRIALIPEGAREPSVVVLWTARAASGTRLLFARSRDGGRSFGPAQSVPGSDGTGNRGWQSMALTAAGEPAAIWLDHRNAAAGAHQHGAAQAQPTDGAARAQLSQILFARLDEPASARAVSSGVCYCCKTSLATGADGSMVAAWRHVYPGNIRDVAIARSVDGGRTFTPPLRVSEDNWVLDGCPENGPSAAVDRSNQIHVVWPTLRQDAGGGTTPALFHAMSRDGRRFSARRQLPTEGVPLHPEVALAASGAIAVVWEELLGGARRVVVARAGRGVTRFSRAAVGEEYGTYPVVAWAGDAAVVVWTNGSTGNTMLRVERHVAAGSPALADQTGRDPGHIAMMFGQGDFSAPMRGRPRATVALRINGASPGARRAATGSRARPPR